MAKPKKQHLPQKVCPICQRPFSWRKKWQNCWEEVKYCSDACRKVSKLKNQQQQS
ncbi:MAG TPA: DUF2256 domain-containing protein [Saprospiraceae bacterium]|nr:DUF2256 domain-containing protein [Saprospiraceae bacterium]HMQ83363.1 DUF2256 domain-containing protein [Saprospiraceae bacterium]